jgi:hypothetical protein
LVNPQGIFLLGGGEAVISQRARFEKSSGKIRTHQYESLQQLALEERKQGGMGSMSAMVREAIDKLIAERRAK